MRKRLKIALNAGLITVLAVLNTPFFLTAYPLLKGPDYLYVMGQGYSMTPAIKHGDTILIKKNAEDIKVGDIIAYRWNLSIPRLLSVTHRVIDIQEEPTLIFRTKGDANAEPDSCNITRDQIIGKVVSVVPTSLLVTPEVLLASILLPAILLAARMAYRYSPGTNQKTSELLPSDLTTVLLMIILAYSVGRLIVLIILRVVY